MAVRNTAQRFDARFPRTGGGEDIDFCLRASPDGLLCVAEVGKEAAAADASSTRDTVECQ
jgi:hypothetical protein